MQTPNTMSALEQVPQPVGPRIRIARENAGLSRSEAAARIGITEATLEAWECDREEPRANRLHMLAGLLNVPLTWFLEGRDDGTVTGMGDADDTAVPRAELTEIRTRLEDLQRLVARIEQRLVSRRD